MSDYLTLWRVLPDLRECTVLYTFHVASRVIFALIALFHIAIICKTFTESEGATDAGTIRRSIATCYNPGGRLRRKACPVVHPQMIVFVTTEKLVPVRLHHLLERARLLLCPFNPFNGHQ